MTIRYKTIKQFSAESGYTEEAIRSKIRDGIWPENQVWVKAPDGRTDSEAERAAWAVSLNA